MRIIIDYLYANQIVGLATTMILILGIIFFITEVYPFDNSKKLPATKKIYYRILIGGAAGFCVFLIVQAAVNPFNVGRAGAIRQAVILNKTIVFTDLYAMGGSELADTPPLLRAWVLDRKTGKLITRKSVESEDPILGANEDSLLIGEEDECYLADDRLRTRTRLVKNGMYGKKKVHRFAFHNGALVLSFKDFSESRVPLPLSAMRGAVKSDVELKYLDTDRETYRVTRRVNGRMIWQLDRTEGAMREHIPEILYESPANDLYLLWTEYRLLAVSKRTGKTLWTFWY